MRSQRFEARGTFRATPEMLWPLLADTPRLNRAIGLPPIEYELTPLEQGGSRVTAAMRLAGLTLARWTEHPFRWEAPRGYLVVRDFNGGLLGHLFERVRAGVQLAPARDRTELLVYADLTPRNYLGALLARVLIGPKSVGDVVRQCRIFERFLNGQLDQPHPQLAARSTLPPAATTASDELLQRGLDQHAVGLLRRHLAEAPDEDVIRMRPFELADRWGLDRRQILALFLHATTAGLLAMTWDVLCPNCRIGKAEYFNLRDLDTQAHCEACNITFGAQFDRLVEVRFSVAPTLRRVEQREFCIGGPMNTPHVIAQVSLPPGGRDRVIFDLAPGSYRLRTSGKLGQVLIEAQPEAVDGPRVAAPSVLELALQKTGFQPCAAEVAAGPVTLDLVNVTEQEQIVVLEGNAWPDTIATAALVSTLQEFRDLFSSEALAPGLQLGIEHLAFMFTDLTGSTALYQAIGQARAFRLVQDHFRVLGLAISEHRGALVKTIGDAVMATFTDGADALAAALRIQRDIRGLAVPDGVDPARLVKIGLHQGPCVAVNLNNRLDYFGTTVNTAARIEHECRGGQIVASLALCRSPAAEALLARADVHREEEIVRLRGVADPLPIYRVTLS
jgi:class 3 adenylate cyclase